MYIYACTHVRVFLCTRSYCKTIELFVRVGQNDWKTSSKNNIKAQSLSLKSYIVLSFRKLKLNDHNCSIVISYYISYIISKTITKTSHILEIKV